MPLAGVRPIEGAAAHRKQAHERGQTEGGETAEEHRLGETGFPGTDQKQQTDEDEGYDRHRPTSVMTRAASASESAG